MSRSTFPYVNARGLRVPSVTEILALAGCSPDFAFVPAKTLQAARERGTATHDWIEGLVDGHLEGLEAPEEIAGYVQSFRRFCDEARFEPVLTEETVVCEAYQYAGKLDVIGLLDGEPILVDLKCTAARVPSARLQTLAYLDATPRAWGMRGAKRAALYLQRDGALARLEPHRETSVDRVDWQAACRMAHWRLRHGIAHITD